MTNKAKEIEDLLTPAAVSYGMEIVDVQYVKEDGSWIARVFIDKDGGIMMSDCEEMSNIFGAVLDEADILNDSYVLEISSPGLNRALKNEKAFKRFLGSKVKIQTFNPINNQKNFLGELLAFDCGKVTLDDVTKGKVIIDFTDIKKANLETDI